MSTKHLEILSSKGRIVAELFERDCPATVEHVERLVRGGVYNRTFVEAVASEGMVRAGEPSAIPEVSRLPLEVIGNRNRHALGALTLLGDETRFAGTRFGIVLAEDGLPDQDGLHTVFGSITEGLDVARALAVGDRLERFDVLE